MTHRFKQKNPKKNFDHKLEVLIGIFIFSFSILQGITQQQNQINNNVKPQQQPQTENQTSIKNTNYRQLTQIVACQQKNIWGYPLFHNKLQLKADGSELNFWLQVAGYLLAIIQIFNGLAILSRKQYNDSIRQMAEEFNMDHDLASSTLYSFGGSTPELALATQAMLMDTNIAFGTVFGSSLFNTLLLGGVACFVGRSTDVVNWFPITRDIIFSFIVLGISIGIFQLSKKICEMNDPLNTEIKIEQQESYIGLSSLMLISVQLVQIIFMKFSVKIEKYFKSMLRLTITDVYTNRTNYENSSSKELVGQIGSMILQEKKMYDLENLRQLFRDFIKNKSSKKDIALSNGGQSEVQDKSPGEHTPLAYLFSTFVKAYKVCQECSRYQNRSGQRNQFKNMEEKNENAQKQQSEDKATDIDENDLNNPFYNIPSSSFLPMLKWLIDLPLNTLYYYTVPAIAEDSNRYVLSFIMCLFYILLFAAIELQLALEISRMLMIDPVLIGIFPLSIGSGIPDMLEILDEVQSGESLNAVLQSTGSNIFVQSLAIPFPILLFRFLDNDKLDKIFQYTDQLQQSYGLVASCFLMQLMLFYLFGWKMRQALGVLFTLMQLAGMAGLLQINYQTKLLQHPLL